MLPKDVNNFKIHANKIKYISPANNKVVKVVIYLYIFWYICLTVCVKSQQDLQLQTLYIKNYYTNTHIETCEQVKMAPKKLSVLKTKMKV